MGIRFGARVREPDSFSEESQSYKITINGSKYPYSALFALAPNLNGHEACFESCNDKGEPLRVSKC